ncbi:MAG: NAD(P)/FAD-dependent oxidoreductase [Verrucomicrobia bacterium]|nr:NAD(P)/FAD-dependent oxidoreductase [Verrucomicrobiota bacterium]
MLAASAASGKRLVRTELARYVPASLARKLCALAGAREQERGRAPVGPQARTRSLEATRRQSSCQSPLSPETTLSALTVRARRSLLNALKECRVRVTGTDGFSGAMVTSGGVDRAEISPRTLESTRVKGLFFAGEVVDVDGPCGGYNLQWAFSSGRLAGLSAAENAGRSPDEV